MFSLLARDISRHVPENAGLFCRLGFCMGAPAAWAIINYRFGNGLEHRRLPKPLKLIPWFFYRVAKLGVEITSNIHLPAKAEIGPGLYIGHFGPIFVSKHARLGECCNISQGVTIGVAGRGENRGAPTFGDRVYLGAGSKVIGKINIGNNVAIGANAVVTKDVPDNAVVAGVPAKILNYNGSSDFVHDHAN